MKNSNHTLLLITIVFLMCFKNTWAQVPSDWEVKENYFHATGVIWENEITSSKNITLQKAFDIIKYNRTITYFYYVKTPTIVDVKKITGPQKLVLNSGDAIFFSGEPKMGTSSAADCYFKKNASSTQTTNTIS